MQPVEIAKAFVERINAHDADGLSTLMTENHSFVDGGGDRHVGREAMRNGWKDFFAMVPDFWIKIEKILHKEDTVALFGRSGGTYAPSGRIDSKNTWEVPAAWQVIILEDLVLTWQVYVDSEPLLRIMDRVEKKKQIK